MDFAFFKSAENSAFFYTYHGGFEKICFDLSSVLPRIYAASRWTHALDQKKMFIAVFACFISK
jgi:hypothetical protein